MSNPIGPYSPIVRAGEWLIVSGQMGVEEGKVVQGGITTETKQAIENIRALLESEGASLDDVRKTTVFLRHMRDFSLMNDAYAEAFGENRPARACIAVVELPAVGLVEIEAWAHAPQ